MNHDAPTPSPFHAAVLLLLACSSPAASGSPTVTGSVQGQTFGARSADFDNVGQDALLIAITDIPGGICKLAEAGTPPTMDVQWLSLYLCAPAADRIGEYPVQPGGGGQGSCTSRTAWGEIRRFVAGTPSLITADGGTITLTAYATDQRVSGNLTLDFGGQALAGEFSGAFCAALNQP